MFLPIISLPEPDTLGSRNLNVSRTEPLEIDRHLEFVSDNTDKELAHFRWKLGHQLTALHFASALRAANMLKYEAGDQQQLADIIIKNLRAANALFQYTASMDGEIYRNDLRFQMQQQHPSFSALWWKEARAVRDVIYGLKKEYPGIKDQIVAFWRLHQKVPAKMGVGNSLHNQQGGMKSTREEEARFDPYFDNFFSIERSGDAERSLLDQIIQIRDLVAVDLERNGLDKDGYFMDLEPNQLMELVDEGIKATASAPLSANPYINVDHIGIHASDAPTSAQWFKQMFGANQNWSDTPPYSPVVLDRLPHINNVTECEAGEMRVHIFDQTGNRAEQSDGLALGTQHIAIRVENAEDLERLHAQWQALYEKYKPSFDALEIPFEDLCTPVAFRDSGRKGVFYFHGPAGEEYEALYHAAPAA